MIWIYGRQWLQHLFLNCLALVWFSVVSFHLTEQPALPSWPAPGSIAEVIFLVPRELIDDLGERQLMGEEGVSGNYFLKTFHKFM